MTCNPPQFYFEKKIDDVFHAEANDALSDLVHIPITIMAEKSKFKFFLPKKLFSTNFDIKDL